MSTQWFMLAFCGYLNYKFFKNMHRNELKRLHQEDLKYMCGNNFLKKWRVCDVTQEAVLDIAWGKILSVCGMDKIWKLKPYSRQAQWIILVFLNSRWCSIGNFIFGVACSQRPALPLPLFSLDTLCYMRMYCGKHPRPLVWFVVLAVNADFHSLVQSN